MQMKKQPPINAVYTWLVWPNKKKKRKKKAQVTHRWINFSSKWTIYEFWGPWLILSACGSGHGDGECKSRPDLSETPHCEAWTWLCQHLMDRFPLRSLLRPRSPRRCCFKLRPACWLRPSPVVLFQRVLYCFRPIVGGGCGAHCAPFLGVLSHSDVLVYVTGQFVRTATVSRYGTPSFPQSPAPRHRARCFQTRRASVCVCVREKNRIDMSLWVIGEKRKQTLHE